MQVVIFFENPMSAVPALLCIFDARHSTLPPVASLDASVTDRLWSSEELVERMSNWEVHAIELVYLDRNPHWLDGRGPDS